MIYVGIDIGKNEHGFAAVKHGDNSFIKPMIISNDLEGLTTVMKTLESHTRNKADIVIGMESTGHYWFAASEFFKSCGYQVDVFNPLISAKREQQNVRGSKSDRSSAVAIAKVVRDDDYSVCNDKDEQSSELKALIRQRSSLKYDLAKIKNKIIAYWDTVFPELGTLLTNDQFSTKAGLKLLENYATAAEIASAHMTKLSNILARIATKEEVMAIRQAAQKSIGIKSKANYKATLSMIRMFRHIQEEIKILEKELEKIQDQSMELLRTMPGMGLIATATFRGVVGDTEEFAKKTKKSLSRCVLAFAGAEPRIKSSGQFTGKIKMSRRGSRDLRAALFMAAEAARKSSPYFKEIYTKHKALGKHHRVAISHVMRKMVNIACAMLKNNEPFSLEKASKFSLGIL